MKKLSFLPVMLLFYAQVYSQCPSGAMGVIGAGCGCLNGCDLTSFGGPSCSPAVGGNCTAGYTDMTDVDIVVPATCTYTVTATMAVRPGCSSSGADGNCSTCDVMKVDVPGGPKVFQQGSSNSTLIDSYVLAGPGTIRVSGRANRADEIVTYSVTSTGCTNCTPLPIALLEFHAVPRESTIELSWATATESNNDYFTIERSIDGIAFEDYAFMDGQGTSDSPFRYNLVDTSPLDGLSYYRLKQTDFDGRVEYFPVKMVFFKSSLDANAFGFTVFPNPANDGFALGGKNIQKARIEIADAMGRVIHLEPQLQNGLLHFDTANLAEGVYFLQVHRDGQTKAVKVVIRH